MSPIAHGGSPPERASIGVWTVIGSVSRRRGGRLPGSDVVDPLAAGVHQEQVRQERQARQGDQRRSPRNAMTR